MTGGWSVLAIEALVTVPLQSVIIILSATRANHAYRHDHKGQAWALTRGHKAGASAVGQELLEKGTSKGVAYDAVHLEKVYHGLETFETMLWQISPPE